MLIRVKDREGPSERKARREWSEGTSEAQYRIQAGIAKAALEVKATGRVMRDGGGRPFHYANGAANFGFRELELRKRGRSTRTIVGDVKAVGTLRAPWPWEKNA